jgi:hypothetical protein
VYRINAEVVEILTIRHAARLLYPKDRATF